MSRRRACRAVLLGAPLALLACSFLLLCGMTGSWWPWLEVVHEDGTRSLLETVLYFEHAARELPLDALLAMAIAGAALRHLGGRTRMSRRQLERRRRVLTIATFGLISLVLVGTALERGWSVLLENLAQMPTRPGEALRFGAHWRYHFLSRLGTLLAVWAGTGLLGRLCRPHRRDRSATGERLFLWALAGFGLGSLLFGLTSEPLSEPRYLGHQLREVLTHWTVTVPLALGACLCLTGSEGFAETPARTPTRLHWSIPASALGAGVLTLYLAIASLLRGAASTAQVGGIGPLVVSHYFEHILTYALVAALSAWLHLWNLRADS